MSPHVQAALFTVLVVLAYGAGFGVALWCDLSRQIDEATRLPAHPHHHRPVEYPTERIPTNNVHDLRRTRSTFEETA